MAIDAQLQEKPHRIDRRVQRTRTLLHEALLNLILEKGYESVTIQDITDKANLGRATFYLHYHDKEELLMSGLESIYSDITQRLTQMVSAGVVSPGLLAFRHVQEHYQLYRVIVSERGVSFIARRVRDYLAAVAQKQIELTMPKGKKLNIPIELVSQHIAGSLLSLITWWLEQKMPHTPEYMAEVFNQLTFVGVAGLTSK
jgi:AcrR family transcriptional regulator